jgi:beta-lactamase regulating signal transducer with metallopeptidase domain
MMAAHGPAGLLDLALRNVAAWSVQVAFVALAAAALGRLLPVERPRARLRFVQALLALVVLLPLLQPWPAASPHVDWSFGLRASLPAGTAAFAGRSPAVVSVGIGWTLVAALALLLGAGRQFARFAFGLARLRSLRLSASPLDAPPWLAALRSELAPGALFRVSAEVGGPATFGFRRPTIVLPAAFLGLERDRQHAIALHELLHVRRGDWLPHLVEELLKALLFFHPAVHWLVGRVRLAREQCVDADVVAILGERSVYLESLLAVARLAGGAPAVPAAPFLRQSHLRERVDLLLKEVPMTRARTLAHLAVAAAGLVLVAAFAAAAVPLQAGGKAAPAAARIGVADEVAALAEPKLVHKVNPVYPAEAKNDKAEGLFAIDVVIDTAGAIREAKVAASAPTMERFKQMMDAKTVAKALEGDPRLAQAAVDAVKQWRYEPILGPNGKPVEARATITVNFRLD